ncbi:uncharacterized protein LOC144764805 [Lissotriton helveticus]
MDSEDLLQCPYDKNHLIRPSRFPYHLVKCRESNPKAAKDVATCPYNARHRVPKQELQLHISNCLDKCLTENFQAIHVNTEKQKPVHQSNWQAPPCQENWDDDDDCTLSTCPFILDQGRASFFEEEKSSERMEQTSNGMIGRTSPSRNVKNSPKKPEPVFFTTHFSTSKSENCSLPNCQNTKTKQRQNSPNGRLSPTRNTQPNPLKHESSFLTPTHFSPRKSENSSFPNFQKTKMEQRLNSPTGRVSPAENTKPNPWKHDAACSAPTHLNPNTSQNASLQNSQRAQTEQKLNSVTGCTSPAWMTKPNPWKHEAASSPPPVPQSTSESPGFPDSQRNKTGLKANGDTAPRWTTNFSPWKPNVGWSSHCRQNTSEAQSLDKDQWPTTMEQKSNGKMVQTCSSCGQNSNHWKTVADPHSIRMWCLGEQHDSEDSGSCQKLTPKTLKERCIETTGGAPVTVLGDFKASIAFPF